MLPDDVWSHVLFFLSPFEIIITVRAVNKQLFTVTEQCHVLLLTSLNPTNYQQITKKFSNYGNTIINAICKEELVLMAKQHWFQDKKDAIHSKLENCAAKLKQIMYHPGPALEPRSAMDGNPVYYCCYSTNSFHFYGCQANDYTTNYPCETFRFGCCLQHNYTNEEYESYVRDLKSLRSRYKGITYEGNVCLRCKCADHTTLMCNAKFCDACQLQNKFDCDHLAHIPKRLDIIWFWQDDHCWVAYSSGYSKCIENAYHLRTVLPQNLQLQGKLNMYCIDFKTMRQRNKHSGRQRDIARGEIKRVALWQWQDDDEQWHYFNDSSPLESAFMLKLNPVIIQVRVGHQMYQRYSINFDKMTQKNLHSVKVRQLRRLVPQGTPHTEVYDNNYYS